MYDLSFYSGGVGVFDRLAILVDADVDLWEIAKQHLRLRTPKEALRDPAWGPEFDEWLCSDPSWVLECRTQAVPAGMYDRIRGVLSAHERCQLLGRGLGQLPRQAELPGVSAGLIRCYLIQPCFQMFGRFD